MICPHCKKPIPTGISPEAMKRARELRKLGYSFRDIEKSLAEEGLGGSFSTISRRFRQQRRRP